MSKSKEIADELVNTSFDSTRHEAAAHILAQEVEIEQLIKYLVSANREVKDLGCKVGQLVAERDEYQQAVDKMAAEHKVERDSLHADNKSYCSANTELLNVSSGLIDALHDCAKALDSAHGFLEFIWREVPLNDWASVQRDLAEKDIDEAIERVKEVLK